MIELPPKSAREGNLGMDWARLGMVKKYFGAGVGAIGTDYGCDVKVMVCD